MTIGTATAVSRGGPRGDIRGRGGRAWRGSPGLTLLAVALGVMMVGIDGTIVAVANPAIQSHLHASLAGIQWVSNAYLLALAVSLITAGKLGDRFGHKKVFLVGVAGFAASSAAIGLSGSTAGSITLVIAFRALQGVFGAMLQPTALALLRKNFPAEKLNTAIGIWGAVIGASTAAGPIVGGLLVQHVGWEACFYINIPVGLIALIMSLRVLRETDPSPAARSFDIPGIAALSGALFLLIWGLIKGPDYGWGSARTLTFLGAAVLAGLLFVLRESRTSQPLLPMRLFRSASLSAGVVLVILLMFAMFGAMFFMTFYLENVHGLDPIAAGVHLLPMTAMLIIGSPLAGALIGKLGPRVPLVAGMSLAAVAMFGLSRLGPATSPNQTIAWFVMLGLGLSPVMVGATNVIVGNAPTELAGVAGGLQSTAMQVGGALGTAVLGAVMSAKISSTLVAGWHAAHLPALAPAQLAAVKGAVSVGAAPVTSAMPAQVASQITQISHATFTAGMHNAFLVAAAVALAGAAIALITRRGDSTTAHAAI
ncbi:MAG TPA: DHA2 family efflux MFS transporter permease subunit [Streptosporangiaceae bacterium]|nr:DHA2 family efflux MFS transporter permease subunit [Streptosporangiaceae bacterium]